MKKVKSWFKSVFQPKDNYEDVRMEFSRLLDVCQIIESPEPDMKKLCDLLKEVTLSVDFVMYEELPLPLELACTKGHPGCVLALIARGADVNGVCKDKGGNKDSIFCRPIHYACMARHKPRSVDCVKLLVGRGADVNAPDPSGLLPIQQATMAGSVEVVEYLLKVGADINEQRPTGKNGTPLMWASTAPSLEEFEQHEKERREKEGAAAAGAEAAAREDDDLSPADFFNTGSRIMQMMRFLLSHGADVHRVQQDRYDCLTAAAFNHCQVDRVLLLLDYGADPNNPRLPEGACILKSVLGHVSEHAAVDNRFIATLSLLIAAGANISQRSLENELRPLLERRPELALVKEAVLEVLEQYAASPLSLKCLCRLKIRALLSPDIDASLKLIPVPEVLRSFLRFEDIVSRN